MRTTLTWERPPKNWRPRKSIRLSTLSTRGNALDSVHWMPDETPTANVAVWLGAVAVQYQDDGVYALVLRPDAVGQGDAYFDREVQGCQYGCCYGLLTGGIYLWFLI